ncbi:hypothetical protein FRC10_004368, partial [Ceratobasidium sp. 414]
MPLLELSDEHSVELLQLETCMLSNQEENHWLDEQSFREKSVRLDELYCSRKRAILLNGNHRIQAILEIGRLFMQRFRDLRERVQKGLVTQSEVEMEMSGQDMMSNVMLASYRVEVYDTDNMPEELLNWLVRNDDERPTQGMSGGELAWWTASRFDELMSKAARHGKNTREEQANEAYAMWARGRAPMILDDAHESSTSKSSSGRKGDWAGPDTIHRLFTEPFTMEMVRDTRRALPAYDMCPKTIAVGMIKASGGLLASHFWLAARTLLHIFDVADGDGLQGAVEYLSANKRITSFGDRSAVQHWDGLHSRPEGRPRLLRYYRGEISKTFDRLYCDALGLAKHPTRDIQWDDGPTILRFRLVFDTVGRETMERKPDWCNRVGLALRLYARLPLWNKTSSGAAFVPSAALPAERWLRVIYEQYKSLNNEAGLIFTEYAFDQYLPIWTVGAQTIGTAVNSNHWYSRSRALHQFAMRTIDLESHDTIDQRLHVVITNLSDIRFRQALEKIQADGGESWKILREQCCVRRSSNVTYAVLRDYDEDFDSEFGSIEIGIRKFQKARTQVKSFILGDPDASSSALSDLACKHPVLALVVPDGFWQEAGALSWVRGWNTSAPRRYQDTNSLIGWAMLTKRMEPLFMELMDQSCESRYLLQLCHSLEKITGRPPWWQSLQLSSDDLPLPPPSVGDEEDEKSGGEVLLPREPLPSERSVLPAPKPTDNSSNNHGSLLGHLDSYSSSSEPAGDLCKGGGGETRKSSQSPVTTPKFPKLDHGDVAPATLKELPNFGAAPGNHSTQPWDTEEPGIAVPSTHVSNLAASALSPRLSADLADDPHNDAGLVQQKYTSQSSTPNSLTLDARVEDAAGPTDDLFDDGMPGYLFTRQEHSQNTLDAILGRSLWDRSASVPRINRAILLNHRRFEHIMVAMGQERSRLRQSMLAVGQLCVQSPYGGFIAESWLAPTLAQLKDIYLTRIALILQLNLEMTLEQAMNEAAAITATDRLYEIEAKRFDHESGTLQIDLTGTFAQGYQAK